MTAEGLLLLLMDMGVVLAPDQDGTIDYLTQEGDLPERLKALMRAHKSALIQLLKTRTQVPPEPLPTPEASLYRRWVTGQSPQGTFKLLPPTYHDTPSTPVLYWGKPCGYKACESRVVEGMSQRFFPSDLCVSCWDRADKRVTIEAPADEQPGRDLSQEHFSLLPPGSTPWVEEVP
jgi:hypothetical protein